MDYGVGDLVEIETKEKTWSGMILESYDSDIILLKLDSGYNIGIRKSSVLNVKVTGRVEQVNKGNIELRKREGLRNVAMIITGGTISSRLDPKTGGVVSTDAEEILNIAPEISEICNVVRIESPFMKFSENMCFSDWKKLAEICGELLNDEGIDGLIITHGTDFLHYTAAALSFFLKDLNKPVALTYSQRSIDRGSTDAALNLICSAKYAVSDIAEVALVGHATENDDYCFAIRGTKARKLHTSRRDAFKSVNADPLAKISLSEFDILEDFNARNSLKAKVDAKFSDKVGVVKVYPGQDPAILDYYVSQGYGGLILEIAGIGQVPTKDGKFNWLPKLKKVVAGGLNVFAVPQTIYGRLNPNVYSAGRDLQKTGIVFLGDMLSETAFVKLGWVLGHTTWAKDKEKIKEKMLENISNEFNEKISN